MKAIAINEFGGRDKLQFMDLPVPEIKPGEILVKVKAAGVNPVDWKIQGRIYQRSLSIPVPYYPGLGRGGNCGTGWRRGDTLYRGR